MTTHESNPSTIGRRRLLLAGGAGVLVALSGCGTMRETGESGTAGPAGEEHLRRIRTAHGLPPLRADRQLERAALEQSAFMARNASMRHSTGFGRDFATRMKKNGINGTAAENLAHGAFGVERMFEMWMNSAGHRRNMLNPDFGRFGLAYTREADGSRRYWALVLAR